jgi:CBS domain containing-hemolysin-like protein
MGLTGVSQLPVVAHDDSGQVLGVIHDRDIMAAYNRAALAMEEKKA